jgi:allantoinase
VDLIIKNVSVVRPRESGAVLADIAIAKGKITQIGPDIPVVNGIEVVDGGGMLAFPGLVDAHMHTGIYAPLASDARSESRAAAAGGVTASLNYIRTGQYYLNRGGPYREVFPEILAQSSGNYFVDYGYHVAPITGGHIDEMGDLVSNFGVRSFKIFMFYGSHGLHGKSHNQRDFLMLGEDEFYDFAHFENVMRGAQLAAEKYQDSERPISVSLHCETAEIMRAYTKMVEKEGVLTGLRAYSASRPPHSEGLAIFIAAYLANETNCVDINLLHLSSRKAVEAALLMEKAFPHIRFRKEVTIGHLLLDVDCPNGVLAKVNPPIRPREDVEFLWQAVIDGQIDWVVSDHACCAKEIKVDSQEPGNVFLAKSGFGGTEYLLSGLLTEGLRRGLSLNRIAELVCWNPARRFGLRSKGDLAPGFDADIVLVDPRGDFVVGRENSPSAQGYSPFDGLELKYPVRKTFLRGHQIYANGDLLGTPKGLYLGTPL